MNANTPTFDEMWSENWFQDWYMEVVGVADLLARALVKHGKPLKCAELQTVLYAELVGQWRAVSDYPEKFKEVCLNAARRAVPPVQLVTAELD